MTHSTFDDRGFTHLYCQKHRTAFYPHSSRMVHVAQSWTYKAKLLPKILNLFKFAILCFNLFHLDERETVAFLTLTHMMGWTFHSLAIILLLWSWPKRFLFTFKKSIQLLSVFRRNQILYFFRFCDVFGSKTIIVCGNLSAVACYLLLGVSQSSSTILLSRFPTIWIHVMLGEQLLRRHLFYLVYFYETEDIG